jgi:dipeptidyl aminopeptidase/acylaminoacyl peptidase
MNKKITFIFAMLFLGVFSGMFVIAQEKSATDQPPTPAKRAIRVSDAALWERTTGFEMSPDGKWQGHLLAATEGDSKLIIGQINGDKKHEFVVGSGSGQINFSHDSKWVGFIEAPLEKAAKAAEKAKKPLKRKLVLINLESDKKQEFENVQSYSFSGELPKFVAIQKSKPAGRPQGDEGWNGTDLILHELSNGMEINIGNVRSFQFNKSGALLALNIDAEGKSGNGVQLFETASGRISPLVSEAAEFKSLAWTKEGDALVCLKATKDKKYELPLHQLVAFYDFNRGEAKQFLLDPTADQNIPDDMTISSNKQPEWTEDRNAILFGIHSAEPKKEKKEEEESKDGEETKAAAPGEKAEEADLVIWHWKDPRLQSQQQVQENRDKNRYDLCIYRLDQKKTIRLVDEEIPSVRAEKPYRYAIGTDDTKYELDSSLNGQRFQDVYTIDLVTGQKKLILEKCRYLFDVSPSGDLVLYYLDGHFFVYNMATGQTRNITENVPVSFIDTESDVNVTDPPQRPYGWTNDGQSVLLSDGFDIWRVPVSGGEATNLTVNGKSDQIRYGRPTRLDPDEQGYDLSKDLYVAMYGEWTKKGGMGLIKPGEKGVKVLKWEDADYNSLAKVKDTDVFYFTRSSYTEPIEFYVCGPELVDAKQVTHSNKQQSNYLWSSGNRLVDYTNEKGEKLQAALFLPANYIEGKKYPTIVYIYEKLSQRLNSYEAPRYGGFSASIYTSQGYAVLMPDIVYEINDPGISSKACVLPALQAAIDTGVVDPENVGLHGHSWGGYQTAFLITQTDKFKAAVAGAPLTNLISMYSSIYWNSGSANQPIFESSQGRFTGGYWTNIEAYTRNSPVYFAENVKTPLLLLHNDADGAVDWNQGIEYFNTLRRLNKPVVMLQYKGENHGLRKEPNRKDYSYRMLEFFNHHLKGEPAAKWWSEGIEHLELKDHIREHRESHKK